MGNKWHDKTGKEITFTAEQCALDALVLGHFGDLETNVSKGANPRVAPHVTTAERVLELSEALPKERAAHWREELVRVGAIDAPKVVTKTEEKPSNDGKNDSGKK